MLTLSALVPPIALPARWRVGRPRARMATAPRTRHHRIRGPDGETGRRLSCPAATDPEGSRLTVTLFVAGLNHKTASVDVRESLAVKEDKLRDVLRDVQLLGVATELVILSTCNRVEVYGVADAPGLARAAAFRELARFRGVDAAAVEPVLYTHVDGDAVRHAFRVAASLDSMMLGEPQILGQVKGAFALAQTEQTVGPALHALFSQAFAVAKRVRTETEIARHAVSVSFAAVELAKKIFEGLEGRAVLLVGAGEMSELAARHLIDQGAFPLYVANRTGARAQELARALAGTAVPFDELATALAAVDIVITSTGAPEPVITRESVQGIIRASAGGRSSSSTSRSRATSRARWTTSTASTATTSTT